MKISLFIKNSSRVMQGNVRVPHHIFMKQWDEYKHEIMCWENGFEMPCWQYFLVIYTKIRHKFIFQLQLKVKYKLDHFNLFSIASEVMVS